MASELQVSDTALRRCVARSSEDFAEGFWGQAPLLSRAAELETDFADLFSAGAVDELASERGTRTPFLRMAKDGGVLPASSYTRGGGAGAGITDQAADDKILGVIAGGSTLVLQGLHRTWPPLVDFGSRLADEIGHPVQINAYVTPPQNQGFAAHFDVHDVFVLQISGRKQWTVHAPVIQNPLDSQPFDGFKAEIAQRVTEPALIDTVLEPGDALYLPRGTVHSAKALGETSIHLTVGVHPLTRYQLARFILDAVVDDPDLRASLPMGADLADPDVLSPHVAATVAALQAAAGRVSESRIAERLGVNLMQRTRPEAIGPLEQLAAIEALNGETPLRRRGALRFRLVSDGTGEGRDAVSIKLLDRTIDLPEISLEVVTELLDGRVLTPADLSGLNGEAQLTLARRLLREGVLVPA
jgi:lysine-specific demethylase/histidyl-hydroxylase NO66